MDSLPLDNRDTDIAEEFDNSMTCVFIDKNHSIHFTKERMRCKGSNELSQTDSVCDITIDNFVNFRNVYEQRKKGYHFQGSNHLYILDKIVKGTDKAAAHAVVHKAFRVRPKPNTVDDYEIDVSENNGKFIIKKIDAWKLRKFTASDGTFRKHENPYEEIDALNYFSQPGNQHPNVLSLVDHGIDKDGSRYIVTKDAGIDLFENLFVSGRTFSEIEFKNIFRQILKAISWLHRHGYAHRDVNYENFVYDQETGICTIIDFGLVYRMKRHGRKCNWKGITYDDFPEEHNPNTIRSYFPYFCWVNKLPRFGKSNFMAPELFDSSPYLHPMLCDYWALAIMSFWGILRFRPFPDRAVPDELDEDGQVSQSFECIKNGKFKEIFAGCASEESLKFIDIMLQVNVFNRPLLETIDAHNWMQ